ncbi:DUF1189 family protein [Alkalibacillus haloalkaliphilus]|uniref:DUF1189 family protein n=1 Tax=Alkalibacillus haloalkaliphilus TaxID=94136 RepID=UPI00031A6427|nr:DUF1189 family protein [Alkalibacillus haloalkaliphilus]
MKVNIIKRFVWSLSNFKNVAKLRSEKISKPIVYLITLMFLLAIPYAAIMAFDSQQAVNQISESTIAEELTGHFDGDTVNLDEDRSLVEEGNTSIAFTEEGFEQAEGNVVLYFQSDQATLVTDRNHYSFLYDDVISSGDFTLQQIVDGLDQFILTLILVSTIIYFFISFVIKLAEVTLLGFAGFIGNKSLNREAQFSGIWKLAVYVATLPTIIVSIIQWTGIQQNLSGIIFWLGSFIIMYLVLKHIPKQQSNED